MTAFMRRRNCVVTVERVTTFVLLVYLERLKRFDHAVGRSDGELIRKAFFSSPHPSWCMPTGDVGNYTQAKFGTTIWLVSLWLRTIEEEVGENANRTVVPWMPLSGT